MTTKLRTTFRAFVLAAMLGLSGSGFAQNPRVVAASGHLVTVAVHVSFHGLDLNQPTDAQTFYNRVQNAAKVVCTSGNRLGLEPVDEYKTCYENALASAIRSVHVPLLTQMYLEGHTLKQAEAAGIDLPPQLAAK
jgi:UrcA family protein